MCNPIPPLFGIEKRKDTLCLADFCLSLAKTDYPLPLASLFTDFSESKKSQKIFAAQTPQRKRGYEEDFALNKIFFSSTAFTKVTTCYYDTST